MSIGKPLNRNGYYTNTNAGTSPDISMPTDPNTPISRVANPWENEFKSPEKSAIASVPDYVPQEVIEEMESSVQSPDDTIEQEEVAEQPENPAPKRSNIAENMRELREAREREESARKRAEKERDEYMLMLQMQMKQQQPQHPPEEDIDDDFDIAPDALVEGKNLKKITQQMKQMKQQLQQYQTQSSTSITEARIRSKYPDFDKVVSAKNVETLNEIDPEIAESLRDTPNLYNKAVAAYKIIKNMGIYRDEVTERDTVKALKNINKPRPLASVSPQQGDSPLSKANAFANGEFTDEMKENMRKEMIRARRQL